MPAKPKATGSKKRDTITAAITVRPLKQTDWPNIVNLFGPNGACGGCWCMAMRLPSGGKMWQESKGRKNRDRFRRLVQAGEVHGVLAFSGDAPVGWCCFGPRKTFPKLETIRALKVKPWTNTTWSVVCFYIPARWRMKGLASKLLKAATERAFALGAQEVEGYPVSHSEWPHPAAFAWMGVPAVFQNAGYKEEARPTEYRAIYEKKQKS